MSVSVDKGARARAMSRMQALLAHQGPLVHVDHAHRLFSAVATGSLLPHLHAPPLRHSKPKDAAASSAPSSPTKPPPATCLWPYPKPGASVRENMKLDEVTKEIARKQHTLRMLVGGLVSGTYLAQMLYMAETLGVLKQRGSDPAARQEKRALLQEMATAAGTALPPQEQWRITALLHELENLAHCKDALERSGRA